MEYRQKSVKSTIVTRAALRILVFLLISVGYYAAMLHLAQAIEPSKMANSSQPAPTPRFSLRLPEQPRLRVPANLRLEPGTLITNTTGEPFLTRMPQFSSQFQGRYALRSPRGEYVLLSPETQLQEYAQTLLKQARAPHSAIVAIEPSSGRVLALADKSNLLSHAALHNGFPAASLFKIITATAALEQGQLEPDTTIRYRGGNYTLNKWNYLPSARTDHHAMTLEEALGKSCNPVFGRVALKYTEQSAISMAARRFGFNLPLPFEVPLRSSNALIPNEQYNLARTGAGFGDVTISPLHAAALMAAVANQGLMQRPRLITQIADSNGEITYSARNTALLRVTKPNIANQLLEMMEATTLTGTARSEFSRRHPVLKHMRIAAKTGTLRGQNPRGLNRWLVAAAPIERPQIAIAVITVDPPNNASKATHLGRLILEHYFKYQQKSKQIQIAFSH